MHRQILVAVEEVSGPVVSIQTKNPMFARAVEKSCLSKAMRS